MTVGPTRVVADCVVFAQALISARGPAAECLRMMRDGKAALFVSPFVLQEVRELPSKLPPELLVTLELVDAFLEDLCSFSRIVLAVPEVYQHRADPDDSHYVNLALASDATRIVTRDKDLLRLMDHGDLEGRSFRGRFPHLHVVSPPQLLDELRTA